MAIGMGDWEKTALWQLKISLLTEGVVLTRAATEQISGRGRVPISLHEYATTGGVTLELPQGVFVNVPFDEPWAAAQKSVLDADADGRYTLTHAGEAYPVRVLPLPGYLGATDEHGRLLTSVAMSHADRVRLSPLNGCAFSCQFCDIAAKKYVLPPTDLLHAGVRAAQADANLPAKHVLISGGTPAPRDRPELERMAAEVIGETDLSVDIMMAPFEEPSFVDRLVDAGVHGFSLNMEVFDPAHAKVYAPQKARLGHAAFGAAIAHAVERTRGGGRVRSLLIAGLEPEESTLAGVEFLARLGCDPVLSPFRPTRGTPLAATAAPTAAAMAALFDAATKICDTYGVVLGPRCIPCQHNTLTAPWGPEYYYS